jgi:hypothetical protein
MSDVTAAVGQALQWFLAWHHTSGTDAAAVIPCLVPYQRYWCRCSVSLPGTVPGALMQLQWFLAWYHNSGTDADTVFRCLVPFQRYWYRCSVSLPGTIPGALMQLQWFLAWYHTSGTDADTVFRCLVPYQGHWYSCSNSLPGCSLCLLVTYRWQCRRHSRVTLPCTTLPLLSVITKLLLQACEVSENSTRFHVFVSGKDKFGRYYSWSLLSI